MKLSFSFTLVFLFLTFTFKGSYAQYYNQTDKFLKANSVWTFGDHVGLDFNTTPPTDFKSANYTRGATGWDIWVEGCASVADPVTGELLFYSNGKRAWSANHQLMPNGDSLLGNGGSCAQGALIVPFIDSPNKYYLFSMQGFSDYPKISGTLFYSVIDMTLNSGLGDIVPGKKDILLHQDPLSESMIAIPGENCDVWVLVHEDANPVFKAYHITSQGLDTVPIVSTTGQQMQGLNAYAVGQMAVSPDRTRIAIGNVRSKFIQIPGGIILCRFDAATGRVFDGIKISNNGCYGSSFSPDGSMLYATYITDVADENPNLVQINQYDVSVYDSSAIALSELTVVNSSLPVTKSTGLLKLYNDKIYFYNGDNNKYIDVIHSPNLRGVGCNYEAEFILTYPVSTSYRPLVFPNDVVFPLLPDTIGSLALDTTICPGGSLSIRPLLQYDNTLWNDGSTGVTRTINQAGTYWVMQNDGCHSYIDTFVVKTFDFPEPVINVNILELGIAGNFNYDSYQWLLNGSPIPGAIQSTYIVSENGDYQVIVNNGQGCVDTSEIYKITNADEKTSIDDIHPLANQIQVFPNPANDLIHITTPMSVNVSVMCIEGKMIKNVQNATSISINELASGFYLLRIVNKEGKLLKTEKLIKLKQ